MSTDLDLHFVDDDYSTHKQARVKRWLAARPCYHLPFTPTYSSWLNQVEWFNTHQPQKPTIRESGVAPNSHNVLVSLNSGILDAGDPRRRRRRSPRFPPTPGGWGA